MTIDNTKLQEWAKGGPRRVFGEALMEACEKNKDVIVLAADLAKALGVYECSKFENQYYNVGIAEQNMIGIACGLAKEGKIPVASSFTPFITMRAMEQIRSGAAYMNLNVKMVGANAGVKGGKAASTHYGLEDIAIMRCIPNMTVLSPCDGLSQYKAITAMIDHTGPVWLRLAGNNGRIVYDKDYDFILGKAITLKEGTDAIILATGPMVFNALDAAELLKTKGVNVGILDFQTIKPLDAEAILNCASKTKLLVTIEEHTKIGGFGGAVAEVLAQAGTGAKLKIMGLSDEFMHIAPYRNQLEKCGLLPQQIADEIVCALK